MASLFLRHFENQIGERECVVHLRSPWHSVPGRHGKLELHAAQLHCDASLLEHRHHKSSTAGEERRGGEMRGEEK